MVKYKNAEKVTEILYDFKHDYNLLPAWIKKAYENDTINTITDDSFCINRVTGTLIANQDDYLVQKENGDLFVIMEDTFNSIYKEA